MRISLYVPKHKKNMCAFIDNEINATKNIKDRAYARKLYKGLTTIGVNLTNGKVFFYDTDEEEFAMFDYEGKDFIYKIDRDFITEPIDKMLKKNRYILVLMDANECTIGELNGKSIKVVWHKESYVPRKHDAGGQSQTRFMENRRLALLQWEKEIGQVINKIYYKELCPDEEKK